MFEVYPIYSHLVPWFQGCESKNDATNVAFENTGVGSDESNQNASCKVLGFPGVCFFVATKKSTGGT